MSGDNRPDGSISIHEATIGQSYAVTINDCCIERGEFTAVLIGWEHDEDEDDREYDGARFDNGVTIHSGWNGAVSLLPVGHGT